MELTLVRFEFTDKSTVGKLSINGIFESYTLEDVCREAVPLTWVPAMKVPTATAIPYGRYRVVLTLSKRFGRILPEILAVPDFEGVRIHPGNKPGDTEGCILVGQTHGEPDWIGNSGAAFGQLYRKLDNAFLRGEKIWLEVTK